MNNVQSNEDKDFDRFWEQYPRKVGKLAAKGAWRKARRVASVEEILIGIERYKGAKPDYADWCHPKTYLSQGRWMDEPDSESAVVDKRIPKWAR
jgi:hypothetical protein